MAGLDMVLTGFSLTGLDMVLTGFSLRGLDVVLTGFQFDRARQNRGWPRPRAPQFDGPSKPRLASAPPSVKTRQIGSSVKFRQNQRVLGAPTIPPVVELTFFGEFEF